MKSSVLKAILFIILTTCIFNILPVEETFAVQTAPAGISQMQVNPVTYIDHHRRRWRRRIHRRIRRRIIHRRIIHRHIMLHRRRHF